MTAIILLIWFMVLFNAVGAFRTICKTMRYKHLVVRLDAERIGHRPFQPFISLVIRCDLRRVRDCIPKIQNNLSLHYIRYEVVLLVDSSNNGRIFERILSAFELAPQPEQESMPGVRGCYRSRSARYQRLTVIDKSHSPGDDLRSTGWATSRGGYVLFIPSLDNALIRNGLADMAVLKMRRNGECVSPIRGVARYDCRGSFAGNIFRMMADLCNLRRIYIAGSLKGMDFGQFVILTDASCKRGEEEYVAKPQMYLYRPNVFTTYLEQLTLHGHTSLQGRLLSLSEFVVAVVCWWTAIRVLMASGNAGQDGMLFLNMLIIPLMGSVLSVFIGEILVKRTCNTRFVLRLLILSVVEAIAFCLFQPVFRILSLFVKLRPSTGSR
jgi:hypothetical protein